MYMKKLEVQGFKSFADKINLVFDGGITAIVGPNGSGKSNVADAIRWVLGEQSVKTLRGAKMEDVIFAGTESRSPVSFAGVSITFDNTDQLFPIDYSEVKITRRVYRSGESEYYINNSKCRLKDIHEMLMDTGIGKDGYSVVGQGQVERIISVKPDDRRSMFEEAAGIVKYKTRKEQAEKKLAEEKNNLLRVNDIISEIESQIEPLERQAEKTNKFLQYKKDLKTYEMNQFLLEHDTINDKMLEMDKEIGLLLEQIDKSKEEQSKAKDQNAVYVKELEEIEKAVEVARDKTTALKTQMEKLEGQLKLSDERILNVKKDTQRLTGLIEESTVKKEEKATMIQAKEEDLEKLNAEIDNFKSRLDELRDRSLDIDKEIRDADVALNEKRQNSESILQQVADKKTILQREEIFIEQLDDQLAKQKEESEVFRGQLQEHERVGKELTNKQVIYQKTLHEYNKEIVQYQQIAKEKSDQLSAMNESYQKAINNLNMDKSRLKFLEDLNNDYEGFNKSVKNILKLKDRDPQKWSRIHGVVSNLIRVPKHLELAVEIALGASIQNVVTEDESCAKNAIAHLKAHKLGRATFLPLNMIKDRKPAQNRREIESHNGFVGFAHELVQVEPKYKKVLSRLLGNVIIAKNFDDGARLAKMYGQYYRIVTIEGEQFNIGGSITGGSYYKKNSSILSRNREIDELVAKLAKQQKRVVSIQEEIETLKTDIDDNREKHEIFVESVENCKAQLSDVEKKLSQVEYLKNYVANKLESIDRELVAKAESKDEKIALIQQLSGEISQIDATMLEVSESIKAIEDSVTDKRLAKEDLSKKETDARIGYNELKQNRENIYQNISWISKDVAELDKILTDSAQQIKANDQSIIEIDEQVAKDYQDIESNKIQLGDTERSLLEFEEKRQEIIKNRDAFTQQVESCLEKVDILNKELGRFENQKARHEVQLDGLRDRIWDEYQLTYNTCLKYKEELGTEKEIKDTIYRLRSKIKGLGNINMNAIEEYTATKERYEFLSGQREDILLAEEKLSHLIDELIKAMEAQFAERFKIIADEFNIVFQRLFGGGKGILKLSDSKNLLEAGIEIIAQPPGKKLQSMTLLSGGEKALTAIALLFAIQKMNPSPFCVLDEIEAALDDSNIVRFSRYLKQLSSKTQYLVITHRKGTMEAADALYGITMQEKGVSKSVSVRFDEDDDEIRYA